MGHSVISVYCMYIGTPTVSDVCQVGWNRSYIYCITRQNYQSVERRKCKYWRLDYITFLMLFLVIFEGNKNGIFRREKNPFRQGFISF